MASMEIHNLQLSTVKIKSAVKSSTNSHLFLQILFFLQRVAYFRKKENYVFKKHAYLKNK